MNIFTTPPLSASVLIESIGEQGVLSNQIVSLLACPLLTAESIYWSLAVGVALAHRWCISVFRDCGDDILSVRALKLC